jgi:prepilin-type N-terminal cleavage/methylation domain-containing protein
LNEFAIGSLGAGVRSHLLSTPQSQPFLNMKTRRGFTLVELLVVIGIIAALIALMVPTLSAARAQARIVQCMSNIRQLGIGLSMYAADNKQKYPPNTTTPAPGLAWTDSERILRYIPANSAVFVCPEDLYRIRSYSMNIWASLQVDKAVSGTTPPMIEKVWSRGHKGSGSLILLTESWTSQGSAAIGYSAPTTIGARGDQTTTAQMFGANGGITPNFTAGPWGLVNCELTYMRHRKTRGQATGTQPIGRITICFDDYHVELCANQDLVDPKTGLSTGLAAWSPLDFIRNQ